MLQALRSTVGSWVVKILFVLLILSFLGWGIGDIFQGRTDTTVAEVGDVKISTQELDTAFRQELGRLRQMLGGQIDAEQARQLGLVNQSLDQLIQRTLLSMAADEAGLRVSDQLVLSELRNEPAFRNQLGQFDPGQFRSVLAANQLTEDAYVQILRSEIKRTQLVGAVAAGAQAPTPLVEDLFRRQAERRVAETILVPNAAMGDVGTPDDAALAAFHQDKAVRFTAPEFRKLTVGRLAVEDVAKEITVSDEDLRAAYDARAEEFQTPERRTVDQVLVADEATARGIESALGQGRSLQDAATGAGAEVITLGSLSRGDLPAELAEPVFTLQQGAVSAPIQSPLGWHLMRVDQIEPGSVRPFEEVRDTLLAEVRHDRAADQVYEMANKVEDALAGGGSIEDVAQQQGLRLIQVDAVDATGHGPDGAPVGGLPNAQQVSQTAFGLQQGATSSLTDTQGGDYFVTRVDAITPAALRPLDSIRPEVVAAWQAEQRAQLAAKRATELADQIRAGTPVEQAAGSLPGAVAGVTPAVTRGDREGGGLPQASIQQLFEMAQGEVTVAPTQDGQIVIRLRDIQNADPAASEAQVAQLRQGVQQAMAGDLLAQFTDALRQSHTVSIHQETVDTMFQRN
ncbi:parvulin peptidyl-prolyl isomerase [Skermanella stibiiresistens SB22]|uniref:Parvulin-like PPIase n=1 Tax=Skermanella stibiiresistens SB22 TaxID=1385369 RepID=W9HC65_9PROT|nr:SurA N-terminal domain-containing protein [Skermanella stibiiresistens]EWY42287.1 parvulin peptidyl-prolyl isomerase [Skermanella stibiiresistens SB22]